MTRTLNNNINNYRWFQFSSSLLAWLPVFFLFFSEMVSLSEVIALGAIYYLSVCLCEVPSGYFSDRIGRRITLILSASGLCLSSVAFMLAGGFYTLALGQFLLAFGMAMMSGTDTAFLYDSLLSSGREQEYAELDARGQKYSMVGLALASLAGGGLGLINLRLPYVASFLGTLWMLWICWGFHEPPRHQGGDTDSMLRTIFQCIGLLKNRVLGWLFGVMAIMYCLEHVAYEFYQPYIRLLNFRAEVGQWIEGDLSPLISAVLIALSMFGGALGAAWSVRLFNLLGVKTLLFTAFGAQLLIISGLSLVLAPAMLVVVVFRNFPMAMIKAPVNATIAPRIGSHLRATYLSIQSLSARLLFSGLLFFLSLSVAQQDPDWPAISLVLKQALIFGVIGALLAVLLAPKLRQ